MPSRTRVRKAELRHLFWAMFFSPNYVQKMGRAFLFDSPVWEKEELGDGGILVIVSEHYSKWLRRKPDTVLTHFAGQMPDIKWFVPKRGTM